MTFLSRLARLGRRPAADAAPATGQTTTDPAPDDAPALAVDEQPGPGQPVTAAATSPGVACPSCAVLLIPPPVRSRRCPSCRRPIVVRHLDGRPVYLTEAAVEVFENERLRAANEVAWTDARASWLRLARQAGAADDRVARLAARPVSAEAVDGARALYTTTALRVVKAAAHARDWARASRVGRELAAALHRAAGSPAPPEPEAAAFHREAMLALLHSLRDAGTHAELVGAGCCAACRSDNGRSYSIQQELRVPRLPHEGCPRGLCACDWWLGGTPGRSRRGRRHSRQV